MSKIIQCAPRSDYWSAVTDVPCPCGGTIRWAEAGYVPGWRECDSCGRQYIAAGDVEHPTLEQQRGPTRHGSTRRRAQAAAEEARRRADELHTIWLLIYSVQKALPIEEHGTLYHPAGHYDSWVSGDDLAELQRREGAVQQLTGSINIERPERGIAAGIRELRRLAFPTAWAVWEELRAALPAEMKIAVSPDGQQATFTCVWTCGSYEVQRVRERLGAVRALVPSIAAQPVGGRERVAAALAD